MRKEEKRMLPITIFGIKIKEKEKSCFVIKETQV